jgi:hypothetical protein
MNASLAGESISFTRHSFSDGGPRPQSIHIIIVIQNQQFCQFFKFYGIISL